MWIELPVDLYWLIASFSDIRSFVLFATCCKVIKQQRLGKALHQWCLKKQEEFNSLRAYQFMNWSTMFPSLYYDKKARKNLIKIKGNKNDCKIDLSDLIGPAYRQNPTRAIMRKNYLQGDSYGFQAAHLLWDIEFENSGGDMVIYISATKMFTIQNIQKGAKYRFAPPNTAFPKMWNALSISTTNSGLFYLKTITLQATDRNAIFKNSPANFNYSDNSIIFNHSTVWPELALLTPIEMKSYSSVQNNTKTS